MISSGFNTRSKSHTIQAKLNKKRFDRNSIGILHVETAALLPIVNKLDLVPASMYMCREKPNGKLLYVDPVKVV